MGLFDKFFSKKEETALPPVNAADGEIVAVADGELIDVHTVSDPMFAEEMMGKSTAFRFNQDKVTICAPANGTLSAIFPTRHAFGITMPNGMELLVHIGINTVNTKGDGFKTLGKKQDDKVKAGDPIVEVDVKKLSQKYDMSTMLVITDDNGIAVEFADPMPVVRGQKVTK